MREIERRLAQLETILGKEGSNPLPAGPFSPAMFQSAILAAHVGGYQEGEAIAEGHARALGLDWSAYRRAIADRSWLQRHNETWARFCASRGFDLATADSAAQIQFMDQLLTGVPDHIRRALHLDCGAADAFL